MFERLTNMDAHHRLLTALVAGVAGFLLAGAEILPLRIIAGWNAFAAAYLALAWVRVASTSPSKVAGTAQLQDSSQTAIFLFVVIAACASLAALAYLLGAVKDMSKGKITEHVAFAFGTVLCSWALVHTVFALRYAHVFYSAGEKDGGGLDFPGEKDPDYLDFMYFSFVIGMTFQVSDVQISSRRLRRLALLHALVSFAFNTVILALSINIISGLL